jgi:hypothetical protein
MRFREIALNADSSQLMAKVKIFSLTKFVRFCRDFYAVLLGYPALNAVRRTLDAEPPPCGWKRRYRIGKDDGRYPWIECAQCGMRSYNRNDIEQRYCGYCHQFHDMMALQKKARDIRGTV